MASVTYKDHVGTMSGKVGKNDDTIHRTRNGKSHAYRMENPYKGPLAETRKAAISTFRLAVQQTSQELADPERHAYWQKEYERYQRRANRRFFASKGEKQYETLRGFVISRISAQLKQA